MQPALWQIIGLAIVQGVAEFLPISSSGHIVLLAAMLPSQQAAGLEVADVNICLHVGTLASILLVYSQQIVRLLGQNRRLIVPLFVATLPVVMVGVPVKLWLDHLLEGPRLAGALLVVTGLVLLATRRRPAPRGDRIGVRQAWWIGLSQAAAILPGLSRSGLTISTALALGITPESAATFSFLMAIPAIAGAGLLEAVSLVSHSAPTSSLSLLALGALVSFVVGVASLQWLLRWLEQGRFHWFAAWCIPVGFAAMIWQLLS